MPLYFSDLDEEIYFAIFTEKKQVVKKCIDYLSNIYGKEFEMVDSDWADEYTFEGSTLLIKYNFCNEDIFDLIEEGVEIHIIKWYNVS